MFKNSLLALLALSTFLSGKCPENGSESHEILVKDASKPFKVQIPLKKMYPGMTLRVVENSTSDTTMIVNFLLKLPPDKTGFIGRAEFFNDTLFFTFDPYKNREGSLKVKYTLHDYW